MKEPEDNSKFAQRYYYFRLQRLVIELVGFWPDVPEIKASRICLAVFNALFLFIVVELQFNFVYAHRDNLALMLDCLTPTSTMLVTGIKMLVIVYYRKRLKVLLATGYKLFTNDEDQDKNGIEINGRMSRYGYLFTFAILALSTFTTVAFLLIPIVKNVFSFINGDSFSAELPFKTVFWFQTETNPNYLIAYVLLSYSGILTGFTFSAIDGMFIGFCVFFTAQFEIIKFRIDTFLDKEFGYSENIQKFTVKQNDRIYKRLSELVYKHNFIIAMCDEMSQILTINVLSHFISAAFVICICLLSLMLAEGAEKAIFMNYIMAATSQVVAYSVGGTIMCDSSYDIKFAAYNFPWYKCDTRIQKAMLLMIARADRETGISVPFFKANIETFGTILKTAMSYITLFKTFL